MTFYRLARSAHADLSGEGARMYGGRYNPRGVPAVYASETIALATLEILVHLQTSEIPTDYVWMAVEVKRRNIRFLSAAAARIRDTRTVSISRAAEFRRVFYKRPVLRVPSIIIPREHDYVLLPESPELEAHLTWTEAFRSDPRLF